MKQQIELNKVQVPEWKDGYLFYQKLKTLLEPYKLMIQLYVKIKFRKGKQSLVLINAREEDLEQLKKFQECLQYLLCLEHEKLNAFFQFKYLDCQRKWKYLNSNTRILKDQTVNHQFQQHKKKLRFSYHLFWKEINLLNNYLQINSFNIDKLLGKYNKKMKIFNSKNYQNFNQKINKLIKESFITRNQAKFQQLINDVEYNYLKFFYSKYQKSQGIKELGKIMMDQLLSIQYIFYCGLFLGFTLFNLIQIVYDILSGQIGFGPSYDNKRFEQIMIMFRGVMLIILYQWLLAWNVYGWNKYNVNYKLIFKFNHHYSTLADIFRRASFFTFIFLIFFTYYIKMQATEKLEIIYRILQPDYCPFIVWAAYLGYIFFPSSSVLNGEGRQYFMKLLKLCLFTPFYKMEFRITWATDQLVSFVGPLKDFAQTFCFYINNFSSKDASYCFNDKSILQGFIIAFIPLIFRMGQCIRQGYDGKKFFGTLFFYNFGKYSCSLLVVILSYLSKIYTPGTVIQEIFFYTWILFAIISLFYSFYWDLKYDWGFLETQSKYTILREKLSFRSPYYYYLAMAVNFILRLTWVLSISTDIQNTVKEFFRFPFVFIFILSFLEMFRRCLWNFFRVEFEHIKNQTQLKAVEDLQFPIQSIQIDNLQKQNIEEQKLLLQNSLLEVNDIADDRYNRSKFQLGSQIQDSFLMEVESNSSQDRQTQLEQIQKERGKKLLNLQQKYLNSQYPSTHLVDNAREFYLYIIKQNNYIFENEKCFAQIDQFKNQIIQQYNSSNQEYAKNDGKQRKQSKVIDLEYII